MKKLMWTKPKITVLVKTNSQEQVLTTCKGTAAGATGTHHNNCGTTAGCGTFCNTNVTS
jgi:hypothetical protein